MKKLLIGLLALTSFSVFSQENTICGIEYSKGVILDAHAPLIGIEMNTTRVDIKPSTFPREFHLILTKGFDGKDVVLNVFENYTREFIEYKNSLQVPYEVKSINASVFNRYIYEKTYLNIKVDGIVLDLPIVKNQSLDVKIPLAHRANLVCRN